jgi:polar amino acid transport system substrate-binding protein
MRSRFIRAATAASAVAAVVIAIAASGASAHSTSASIASSSSTSIGTKTPGTLLLGADFTAIPNQMIVGGKMTGFDYDLCQQIGKELGFKIQWANVGFDSLIPGLQGGRFDALCTAVDITAPREKIMNMIQYTKWGVTMFTLNKDKSEFKPCKTSCYSELSGQTVAVPSGGNEVLALQAANKKLKNPMKILQFSLNQQVFQAVSNGTASAGFLDDPEVAYFNRSNGLPFTTVFKGADPTPVGLTTLKSNTTLANALVKALKMMKANGTYAAIIKKWNLEPVSSFTINPPPGA